MLLGCWEQRRRWWDLRLEKQRLLHAGPWESIRVLFSVRWGSCEFWMEDSSALVLLVELKQLYTVTVSEDRAGWSPGRKSRESGEREIGHLNANTFCYLLLGKLKQWSVSNSGLKTPILGFGQGAFEVMTSRGVFLNGSFTICNFKLICWV